MAKDERFETVRSRMGGLAGLLAGVGMIFVVLYSLTHPEKQLALNYADGTYENDRCGTLVLSGGSLSSASVRARYTLEQGKFGPRGELGVAAITEHLLGVSTDGGACRVVYEPTKFPLYLVLGDDVPPTSIELWDTEQSTVYTFVRAAAK